MIILIVIIVNVSTRYEKKNISRQNLSCLCREWLSKTEVNPSMQNNLGFIGPRSFPTTPRNPIPQEFSFYSNKNKEEIKTTNSI